MYYSSITYSVESHRRLVDRLLIYYSRQVVGKLVKRDAQEHVALSLYGKSNWLPDTIHEARDKNASRVVQLRIMECTWGFRATEVQRAMACCLCCFPSITGPNSHGFPGGQL